MATNFWSGQHWRKRLEQIVHQPTRADVLRFMQATVLPAMRDVVAELGRRGVQAHVQDDTAVADPDAAQIRLTIPMPELRDFVYGVRPVRRKLPGFMLAEVAPQDKERLYVVEPITFFADGRSGYDIQYLRGEEVIADILRHYERYLSASASQSTQLLNRAPGHDGPV